MTLAWPRAETPAYYISMGTDVDLTQSTRVAVQEMVDFIAATRGLDKHAAYQLTSIAADISRSLRDRDGQCWPAVRL